MLRRSRAMARTMGRTAVTWPGAEPLRGPDELVPKFVTSRTLAEATWNCDRNPRRRGRILRELKRQPGGSILKYGNGPLDRALMEHDLIDEFHLLLTAVAAGAGQHPVEGDPGFSLVVAGRCEAV